MSRHSYRRYSGASFHDGTISLQGHLSRRGGPARIEGCLTSYLKCNEGMYTTDLLL